MSEKSSMTSVNSVFRASVGFGHQNKDNEKVRRLANPFLLVAALWISILILYSFSWSNLCTALSPLLILFIALVILTFLLLGHLCRDCLVIHSSDEPSQRMIEITTAVICAVVVAGMIYNKSIPLLVVLQGNAYNSDVTNLPVIGTFITAVAIWHAARLSYYYRDNRSFRILIQLLAIFSLFILTVQRQNLMVCIIAVIFSAWSCRYQGKHFIKRTRMVAPFLLALSLAVALFVFGAIGNARYGTWSWNDSSMISALGEINDRFPSWLPREYAWAYVYLVSPLANLNNNIQNVLPEGGLGLALLQLLPSSVAKRMLPASTAITPYLVQPSLTASTSYVNAYVTGGFMGMFVFMCIQQLLIFMMMKAALNDKGSAKFAGAFSVFYYAGLTFFDNPSTYLITSYLWIVVILHSYWPQISRNICPLLNKRAGKAMNC